jgi:hypothetical protein
VSTHQSKVNQHSRVRSEHRTELAEDYVETIAGLIESQGPRESGNPGGHAGFCLGLGPQGLTVIRADSAEKSGQVDSESP